jgi:hypothetical protein
MEWAKDVKFGVCHSGSTADLDRGRERRINTVTLPTVHAHGARDPWVAGGRGLRKNYYDESKCTVIDFDGGHNVVKTPAEVKQMADAILAVSKQ